MGIKEVTEGYLTYGKCYRCSKKLKGVWYIIELDEVPLEFCEYCGGTLWRKYGKCQQSQ